MDSDEKLAWYDKILKTVGKLDKWLDDKAASGVPLTEFEREQLEQLKAAHEELLKILNEEKNRILRKP